MIDLFAIINEITLYLQANVKIGIAVGLLLLFLLFKKTKLFLLILFITLLLAGLLHMISSVAGTGSSYKKDMVQERNLL